MTIYESKCINCQNHNQTSAPPILVDKSDGYKYFGQKGWATMLYTHLCSVHLFWFEKVGAEPDVTFGIITHKQERVQARDPFWI